MAWKGVRHRSALRCLAKLWADRKARTWVRRLSAVSLVVERLGGCILDGAVHALGLAVGPRMAGLGEPVFEAVLVAHAVERVAHGVPLGRSVLGERDAVVGEHATDLVGKRLDDASHERGTCRPLGGGVEFDRGELGHAVDGEEHVQLALGGAQLATVRMDIADFGFFEALLFGRAVLGFRQSGDAMALEAAMERAAGEGGNAVAQAAEHVIERQQGSRAELDDDGLLGLGQHGAAWLGSQGCVGGGGPLGPFQDGLGVEAVLGGEGAGRRLRRLEFGSNSRRCAG